MNVTPLVAAVVVCLGASHASALVPKEPAELLVGRWVMTKTSGFAPVGTVVEFGAAGEYKITLKLGKDDKVTTFEGTYKVDGKKVTLAFTEGNKKTEKAPFNIRSVDGDHLVIDGDPGEEADELRRLK